MAALRIVPDNATPSFTKAGPIALAISAFLCIGSLVLSWYPGLNLAIDMRGGVEITAHLPAGSVLQPLRAQLDALRPGPIELEERVSPLDIAIRAEPQTDGDWSATAVATAIRELLLRNYPGATIESLQAIDPANARERLRDCLAVLAIVLVLMAVYFSSRFTWPYNAAATLALLLDTSLIVGLYALVQFPFDATSIAAILAVAGYSILDKGVLYGRMSKKLRARPDMSLRELVEGCIHEGLHRSIIVTGTATLAILPPAVLGSGSLQDLALVLLVGIIIAPMSSIFVAAPTLLLLGKALFAGDAGRSAAHIRPVR